MPASFPPRHSTSLGHFRLNSSAGTPKSCSASASANAAEKLRSAACPASGPAQSAAEPLKFPSGAAQARPRRPRAAVWISAVSQNGSAAPAEAMRIASALVLSSRSWCRCRQPAGQPLN